MIFLFAFSHLSNKRGGGGLNKRGGGAKFAKSLNMEGGILWKKLMHNSNKRGVEGGKNLKKSINVEGGFFLWRVEFLKNFAQISAFCLLRFVYKIYI